MANIYTYPEIGGLSNEDLFIVTDVSNDNSTKSLSAEDLQVFVTGATSIVLPGVVPLNFANDQAAAAGGVPIGGLYHKNSGQLHIRLT
jgi:hypothetical protein